MKVRLLILQTLKTTFLLSSSVLTGRNLSMIRTLIVFDIHVNFVIFNPTTALFVLIPIMFWGCPQRLTGQLCKECLHTIRQIFPPTIQTSRHGNNNYKAIHPAAGNLLTQLSFRLGLFDVVLSLSLGF